MLRCRELAPLALLALLAGAGCRTPTPLDGLPAEISESLTRILDESEETSAAVALVGPGGFVWTKGFGTLDGGDTQRVQPVDADTLFSLQSTTKVFTAIAVMRAVEDGHLDLDQPIRAWLPGFTVRSRFEASPEDRISLRLLLSHRAGLTHEAPVGNNLSAATSSFDEHLASIPDTWLRYPVGERYAYSNLGIDVAGWVLQAQSGRPFDEVVRNRVLEPLGMERSRFATSGLREEPNRAVGRVAGQVLPPEIPILASGGLYSSANDLARFLRFQLDRGEPLLGRGAWEAMHEIAAPVSEFQSSGYGLGVLLRRADGRIVVASHGGGGYGFASEVVWMPDLGVGFAALQTTRGSRAIVDEVTQLFKKRVTELAGHDPFAEGLPDAEPADCLPSSAASPPRGAWVGRGTQVVTMSKGGEFGILGSGFKALCPIPGARLADPEKGLRDSYRVESGRDGRPVRLVGLNSGRTYDYNDGPDDLPGPGRDRWRPHLGTYEYSWHGLSPVVKALRERNGTLYFDDLRLFETEPQLFAASNGEVLDLRGESPSWRSVRIRKVAGPLMQEAREAVVERALGLFQLLRDGNPEAFQARCAEPLRAVLSSASSDLWSAQREAPEPVGVEVDDLGSTTRVILLVPNEEGVRRVEMYFGDADRLEGLLFVNSAPRTWWHWVGANASPASLPDQGEHPID